MVILDNRKQIEFRRILYPTLSDIPDVFYVEVRDSVLDDDNYPITKVVLKDGKISELKMIHFGVYTIGLKLGMNKQTILKWFEYNDTGNHPEIYHDLLVEI